MNNLAGYLIGFANVLMVVTSLFLICLVLIQRGKGGGLAGAFGGAGGSSAFGTKAGDVFTRVTIIVAGFWFLLALLLVYSNNRGTTSKFGEGETPGTSVPDVDLRGRETSPRDKNKKTVPPVPTPPDVDKSVPPVTPASPAGKATPPTVPPSPPEATKAPATPAPPPETPAKPKS